MIIDVWLKKKKNEYWFVPTKEEKFKFGMVRKKSKTEAYDYMIFYRSHNLFKDRTEVVWSEDIQSERDNSIKVYFGYIDKKNIIDGMAAIEPIEDEYAKLNIFIKMQDELMI